MSRTAEATAQVDLPDHAGSELQPVSMAEAVGYPAIECASERLAERGLVLKHDRLFMLADRHGNIAPAGVCSLGLFQDDTRILSHYGLSVHGGEPDLLSAQVPTAYGAQIDLAVSNLAFGGDPWDPRNVVHMRRELALDDRLIERLTLTGYLGAPADYWVELTLGCDFADIFEVRGWRREMRGQYFAPRPAGDSLEFAYRGRDGRLLRTAVRFRRRPDRLTERAARWNLRLELDKPIELEWEVCAIEPGSDCRHGRPCAGRMPSGSRSGVSGVARRHQSVADRRRGLRRAAASGGGRSPGASRRGGWRPGDLRRHSVVFDGLRP